MLTQEFHIVMELSCWSYHRWTARANEKLVHGKRFTAGGTAITADAVDAGRYKQ